MRRDFMARSAASARPITDHDEIRRWAGERGARPARVRGTGSDDDIGMIRLDFPGYSGGESLEEISWDDWFEKFDDSKLALLVQDQTAGGEQSNFNKLVTRDGAGRSRTRSASASRSPSGTRSPARSRVATSSRATGANRSGRSASARAKQSSGGRSSRMSANGRSSSGQGKGTRRSAAGKKGAGRATQARGQKASRRGKQSNRRAA